MKRAAKDREIVWAIDPYCENCAPVKQTARVVSVLASQYSAEIQPVYVVKGFPPNLGFLPKLIREMQANAQKKMNHLIRGAGLKNVKPIQVLIGSSPQLRTDVDRLIKYAKDIDAALIIVGTRARSGLNRWIMGSFAETLMLRSDIPLYVIHPTDAKPGVIKHVLFPTDFSNESKQAFDRVIGFSKRVGAKITVFHKIGATLVASAETAYVTYPLFEEYFEDEVISKQQQAQAWANQAKEQGVQADAIVDYKSYRSVSDAIIHLSKKYQGIIALAAHSGPIATALLGSTTRQTVRSARCPVWVIHTERKHAEPPYSISEEEIVADLEGHGNTRGLLRKASH